MGARIQGARCVLGRLLAVDVGGSDIGFGGRTHYVRHDSGDGVNGDVEACSGGGWLCHVWALVY